MQKIVTFLMFEGNAEEAMNFYVSLFPRSSVLSAKKYGPGQPGKEGSIMHATFSLAGQQFMCIDSPSPHGFGFTPSMSQYVFCATAAEIDELFERLSEDGKVMMPLGEYPFSPRFGWVSDKFGITWQLSLSPSAS